PPVISLELLLGSGDEPLLSPSLPTFLRFKCILAYMAPSASDALIQWFINYFVSPSSSPLSVVVYEMFKLGDTFRQVMLNNLKSHGISLPSTEAYPDITSLSHRFLDLGFTAAQALTLREIRSRYVGPQELQWLLQLKMLDKVEELELVLNHYAISWGISGINGASQTSSDFYY
ncbi:S-adenosyl-L-methionine-dependent methyltransferase, partial [Lactarius hatsudake]